MTIDRRLYQKVTGKVPGEALNRMGESLAQRSARMSSSKAGLDRSFSERYFMFWIKYQAMAWSTAAVIAVLVALYYWLFR